MVVRMDDACCGGLHPDAVADVRSGQLAEPLVLSLSEAFKALADPTRIRMLHCLLRRELCVCDLAEVLGMTQSAVSHQLRYLRTLRIVRNRREGNTIYYTCDDAHIAGLLQMGIDHAMHGEANEGGA
ncbi:MAG: ArsR/SmtB family transcription factor [Bacilli bacterium]